ncbi:MAG TPA: twin-arginine translocase TatA/TatE family subunit [Chryseosolibacter sp.]
MSAILLFMGLGMQELLLIGLVILIFFGAKKIPEFMKGLGRGVREFKDGIKEVEKDVESTPKATPTTTTTDAADADDRRD